MKASMLHQQHVLSADMTEGEVRCLIYDLRCKRRVYAEEAVALAHFIEDIHQELRQVRQQLEEVNASAAL